MVEKKVIHKYINEGQHDLAMRGLLKLIEDEPTMSNYCFVSETARKVDFENLDFLKLKVAILRSFTIEPILPYLETKCYQAKLKPEIYLGGYNMIQQEILNRQSRLYSFHPEILIFAIRPQELCPKLVDFYLELSEARVQEEIDRVLTTIDSLLSAFRENSSAKVILHNFELPTYPALGILDSQHTLGQSGRFREINARIDTLARKYRDVYVLDYEHLQSLHGKLNWFDEKMWHIAKSPLSRIGLMNLASEYVKYFRVIKGMNKKCLALDLDNTLWGGILSEDGLERIKVGPNYPGSMFVDFQKAILNLYNHGILLAINSKNDMDEALEALEKHPHNVLRKKHFAAIRVNWQDKVQNLREIAHELRIGLDAVVFMDDSPFECELIRKELPEVLTVQLPNDVTHYRHLLMNLDCFQTLTYSTEDRNRGAIYQAQRKRERLKGSCASLEDFYHSLEMEVIIGKADARSIPRIAQLTQRTNQFNLTTRRYFESDITRFAESQTSTVYCLRLIDKFGDNGITGVAMVKKSLDSWTIDTFLLSCRIIGRTVETAFLTYLLESAKKEKISYIIGEYIPTKKNALAEHFYKEHGFEWIGESLSACNTQVGDRATKWKIDLKNCSIKYPEWLKVTIQE